MTTVSALAVFGGATGAAHAAPGDDSNATGTFLGGSILNFLDLDAIAEIDGAAATNDGTIPVEQATDFNTLDLTALGVVNVTAPGGVQIPIDLGSLGVVGQYASAAPNASSVGASGLVGEGGAVGTGVTPLPGQAPGPLSLDLTGAVNSLAGSVAAGLVDDLADVDLTVGAVSANASQAAPGAPVGDYTIAGAELTIQSDTVAALTGEVNEVVTGLQTTVDNVDALLNSAVTGVLGVLGGLLNANLSVGTTSLTDAVSGLLTGEITSPDYPGVTLNLDTGDIIVDLAEIVDLNNLAPGTEILSGETVGLISDAVVGLVDGLLDDVTDALVPAIRGLSVTGGVSLTVFPLPTAQILTVNTTVGALLDGDTSGVSLLGIGLTLPGGLAAVVAALTAPLQTLVTSVGPALDAVLTPVTAIVAPALDAVLPLAASLTANNQSTSAEGVFSETALILTVLPAVDALTVELANATVGPNAVDTNADVTITDPEPGFDFVVPDEDDLTSADVSGTGQDGAVITVTIPGQDPQTATVAGGVWTVTFADLPVGAYVATATQDVDGTTATVAFDVVEAPDVAITAPEDGQQYSVAGADDTADVIVEGTGYAGSDVEVEVDGQTQTVTVAPEGTWTATFPGIGVGDYTATATQAFDGSTAEVDFVVADAADVAILAPEDGEEIVVDGPDDLAEATVSGTGAPGAIVTVSIPGVGDLTDAVDQDGAWSVTFPDVPVDDYTATATQDVDDSTTSVDFSVVAAEDVQISAPAQGEVIPVPDEDSTDTVVVEGTGQEGATVTVAIPSIAAQPAATVEADGTWSVEFPGVGIGSYTATATQSDGSTATVDFSVAAAPDVVILTPADGDVFSVDGPDSTQDVVFTGTGFPGATIEVFLGSTSQTAIVTPGGTWTTTFEDLPVGNYGATAEQDFDESTAFVEFEIAAETDVEIEAPADGSTIFLADGEATTDVTVSGIGYDDATVTVSIPGQPDQIATVVAGTWSVVFPGLGVGNYAVTAVQDVDGSIDTSNFLVGEADGIVITAPFENERLLVAEPGEVRDVIVAGQGEAGLEVEVSIPALGTETVTVSPLGIWTVTFEDVAEGAYTATAVQENGATDSVTFSVDAAADIEIDAPADGDVFAVPGTASTADVTVSGTGDPDADGIEVTLGTTVLETTVTPAGTWSVTFTGLPVGDYLATAAQIVEGEEQSEDTIAFEVEAIEDIEILAPEAGDEFVVDGPADTTPVTVSGTGYTGQTVTVEIAGQTALTSPVVAGEWSVTFPALGVGAYTAVATQDGDSSTASVDFSVRDAEDVTIEEPADGDVILVPDAGDPATIEVSGTGEPGQTVTVEIPGIATETAVVGEDGNWEVTLTDIPEGEHTITATQDDGSVSEVDISVEAVDDVLIQTPADGEILPADGTVDVTVSGIGQPGETITLVLDEEVTETTTVLQDGTWTETFADVEPGEHTVTAEQSFDGSTDEVTFEVEDITDVEIDLPVDGAEIFVPGPTDTTPVAVSGTGYDGQTITVEIPGLPTQTTVVDGTEWTVTFPGVPVGGYTATATQSGDGSTATVDFTVSEESDVTITTPEDGAEIFVPDEDDTADFEVCGTGQDGAEVTVTIGDLPEVVTVVDPDGEWCVDLTDVPTGEHEITAEQEDGSDTTITVVVDHAQDVLITDPTPGFEHDVTNPDGTHDVPVSGVGHPGEDIDVVLNEDETIETTVDEDGTWSVVFEGTPIGLHVVAAFQVFDDSSHEVDFAVVDAILPVAITEPADGAQLTVPAEGDTREVGVAGTGDPGSQIAVFLEGLEDEPLLTEVAEDGTWSVVFEGLGVGTYAITALQEADESSATVNVSIAVGAPDTSGARADVVQQRIVRGPNASQTVAVSGFQPGETVSGTVNSTPFELVPTTADAFGNARITFAVGPDFELGNHRIEVRGSVSGELPLERENTAFLVVAPAAGPGSLPATGGEFPGLAVGGLGIAMLLAGAVLYAWRRRAATE